MNRRKERKGKDERKEGKREGITRKEGKREAQEDRSKE